MAYQKTMEYWIKTAKRMPNYEEVFVAIRRENYNEPILLMRIYGFGRYCFIEDTKYSWRARKIESIKRYCYTKKDIVYWLPLPIWPLEIDEDETFKATDYCIEHGLPGRKFLSKK